MSKFLLSFLLILSISASSQIINEDYLVGVWEVVSVESEPTEPPFNLMVSCFKNCKIHLNKNRTAKIISKVENEWFKFIKDSVINRSKWDLRVAEEKKMLVFNYDYMVTKIGVTRKNRDILFSFFDEGKEERIMVLKMRKEN